GLGRQPRAFAGQCRPAPGAEPAPGSSRCRIELGYLALGDCISRVLECDKDRSGCAAMLAATLAMAPIDAFRSTSRNKTDGTAEAATFEPVGRASHDPILQLRHRVPSTVSRGDGFCAGIDGSGPIAVKLDRYSHYVRSNRPIETMRESEPSEAKTHL